MLAKVDWFDWLGSLITWGVLLAVFDLIVMVFAIAHVVLNKRDVRAAIGWTGVILLAPLVGWALYWIFGVNRLKRKARRLLGKPDAGSANDGSLAIEEVCFSSNQLIQARLERPLAEQFSPLATLVDKVVGRPLLGGNQVELYPSLEQGFAAMLAAIENAKQSVTLCTYIFDRDAMGKQFVTALQRAQERGVQVRVIVDGVGIRYSWPSIKRNLKAAKIRFAVFMPSLIPWRLHYTNLRNHRKIMVVDGCVGFTGGLNIRQGLWKKLKPPRPQVDSHFRIVGPVVRDLQETFADDWEFCTGELLDGDMWFPTVAESGDVLARGIADGPDLTSGTIRLTLAGAISAAQRSVYIVTPYFLPDAALIEALNVADLRGVDVKIVLPKVNNLLLVQWASTAHLWQLLSRGVQIWTTPPPFDHSKLMVVDEAWCMFGSANMDPRSLRLNFEFNVECYAPQVAGQIADLMRQKIATAHQVTLAEVDGRSLPIKLRDGLARLATPYL
ncbi:MAG: cardiolipin synthase [Pirellulaceae bacterium]|nr:cardiolipin synthase [Pirellulaceae bacterium]